VTALTAIVKKTEFWKINTNLLDLFRLPHEREQLREMLVTLAHE